MHIIDIILLMGTFLKGLAALIFCFYHILCNCKMFSESLSLDQSVCYNFNCYVIKRNRKLTFLITLRVLYITRFVLILMHYLLLDL